MSLYPCLLSCLVLFKIKCKMHYYFKVITRENSNSTIKPLSLTFQVAIPSFIIHSGPHLYILSNFKTRFHLILISMFVNCYALRQSSVNLSSSIIFFHSYYWILDILDCFPKMSYLSHFVCSIYPPVHLVFH